MRRAMNAKCHWCHVCAKEKLEDAVPEDLEQLLPEGYCHSMCSYRPLEEGFEVILKLQYFTREEAEAWLEDFQRSSRVTLRKEQTFPNTKNKVRHNSYRVNMRCQHNTRNAEYTKKNTNCPAGLYLVVKKLSFSQNRRSRSKDGHIQEGLLTHVTIKHNHNHPLDSAEILKQRSVSKETVEKLEKLFQSGHSPCSALNTLKYDLQEELGDSYVDASADRSICPDFSFCYRLYNSIFKKTYVAASGDSVIQDLQERLVVYNNEQRETCGLMELTADGQIVVAFCTPLMKRIHRLARHSGEIVVIDSSGYCGKNSRAFLLLTHSAAGGLPLGVIVTKSESQNSIATGLNLLKTLLPGDAFYGRGELGPNVFMTNDCKALRQALQNLFPQTTPLLSVFHVLHAMWRWLWDGHHEVPVEDRQWLLDIFKKLVCARSPVELKTTYHQALLDPVMLKNQQYRDHLTAVFAQRRDWATCLCTGLSTWCETTNNFVENTVRILKDSIFYRLKTHTIIQLVDLICTRLEGYYTKRLLGVASGRPVRCEFQPDGVDPDRIVQEDESIYTVTTKTGGIYLVNISLGMCTCPAGSSGALCKHQHAVTQAFKLQGGHHHLPVTSFMPNKSLYEMATGIQEEVRTTSPLASEDSGAEEASVQSELDAEHVESRLRSMFDDLMDKFKKDKTFQAPLESFLSSFEKIHTDSNLISALSTFGKMESATSQNIQPTDDAHFESPLEDEQSITSGPPPKRAKSQQWE
uniref:Si:dkey-75a21.2 n=1 Tax=Nothobranchius pienaari TaxID=704102 RepID=A0A1A8L8P5_9TELE